MEAKKIFAPTESINAAATAGSQEKVLFFLTGVTFSSVSKGVTSVTPFSADSSKTEFSIRAFIPSGGFTEAETYGKSSVKACHSASSTVHSSHASKCFSNACFSTSFNCSLK